MYELIRALRARLRRSERGGVVVVAATVLGMGVVMGTSALVVDVGQIYGEREQLQSGADSAALALAKHCAVDPAHCASQSSRAGRYANANADDGASQVTTICGTAPGLDRCPAPPNGLPACLGTVPAGVPYVEVRTGTQLRNGSTALPPTFAGAITGTTGKQILACARAGWGGPVTATVTAVTASVCDWNALTSNGTVLPPLPSVAPPSASDEGAIYLHDPHGNSGTMCTQGGQPVPGGFGWLDDSTGNCQTQATVNGTVGSDPGNNVSQACQSRLSTVRTEHGALLVPLFDDTAGQGQNAAYTVAGMAAFVLTGYNLSGFSAPSWLSGRDLCTGADRCLYGYFASVVMPGHGSITGTNYGASIITVVG